MVGALANGKAGLADFPRVWGKHIHARDGTSRRVSAEHRPAEQPVPPSAMKIAAAPSKAASFSAGRGKLTVSRREGGLFNGLDRMCRLREAHRGALRRPLRRVRRAALPRL